jgi:hypothetical protein
MSINTLLNSLLNMPSYFALIRNLVLFLLTKDRFRVTKKKKKKNRWWIFRRLSSLLSVIQSNSLKIETSV